MTFEETSLEGVFVVGAEQHADGNSPATV